MCSFNTSRMYMEGFDEERHVTSLLSIHCSTVIIQLFLILILEDSRHLNKCPPLNQFNSVYRNQISCTILILLPSNLILFFRFKELPRGNAVLLLSLPSHIVHFTCVKSHSSMFENLLNAPTRFPHVGLEIYAFPSQWETTCVNHIHGGAKL
jgi:hypothetical protein